MILYRDAAGSRCQVVKRRFRSASEMPSRVYIRQYVGSAIFLIEFLRNEVSAWNFDHTFII